MSPSKVQEVTRHLSAAIDALRVGGGYRNWMKNVGEKEWLYPGVGRVMGSFEADSHSMVLRREDERSDSGESNRS